jgi:peptidoglycan/LPS O-acetylase OafA/YrhL
LVLCFLAGIVLHAYKDKIAWRWEFAVACFILALWTTRGYTLVYVSPLFSAYLTVYLGMLNPKRSVIVNSGDYSYGTYLYAGPIQQTVVAMIGTVGGWAANVAISLPVTVLFALFSWWCGEKPVLAVRARMVRARQDSKPRLSAPDLGRIESSQSAL